METSYKTDSPEITVLCKVDARLALVINHYGDLTYMLHSDPFAHTIENIVGQMLSSKAADAIAVHLYSLTEANSPAVILKLDALALRGIWLSTGPGICTAH